MAEALSNKDAAFLERLRNLVSVRQSSMPAVTKVVGRGAGRTELDETQQAIRDRWDFDGSIVVGRVDTVDGERFYIGTRSVMTADEGVLVLDQDSELGRSLWEDVSKDDPGRVQLKRQLRVSFWTLAGSRTEFDLRGQAAPPPPPPPPPPPQAVPAAGIPQVDLLMLRETRDAALAILQVAAGEVEAGRAAPVDDLNPALSRWNADLASAAQALGVQGPAPSLADVEETADGLQRAARRTELDHKISVLADLIAEGDLGREELEALQRKLVSMRDEADALG